MPKMRGWVHAGVRVARFSTHEEKIRVLEHCSSHGVPVTYPDSSVITPRHFYQTSVSERARTPQRPVSLRQLAFYGRKLTEEKILMSANYVVDELAVRIAHRAQEMQTLPYKILNNRHLTKVYEKYVLAFDKIRCIGKIETLADNERFCEMVSGLLADHGYLVPDLLLGVRELVQMGVVRDPDYIDNFVRSMLMSRISRRVIAEQHVSLSDAFDKGVRNDDRDQDYIGEVFLQCNTKEIIERAGERVLHSLQRVYPDIPLPAIELEGEPTTFPYIRSHLDYIVGEVLRNSCEASIKMYESHQDNMDRPSAVSVAVSSTKENTFIRVSDRGGGIPQSVADSLWSFVKPQVHSNLSPDKLNIAWPQESQDDPQQWGPMHSTLQHINDREPGLKLGIGLALARIYTEYWGGALEIHSLEGYGCDTLLRISNLGTKLENLHLNRI